MKTKIILLVLGYFIFAPCAFAANWYVDSGANGTNDGTSWSNAWTSFSNITGISPDDTIYISGGSTSKTYNETLFTTAGSSGNPITYKIGQVPGHNGKVIIDVQHTRNNGIATANYVTIDGQVGTGSDKKIEVKGALAHCVNFAGRTGVTIKYLEVHDCGDSYTAEESCLGGGSPHGLEIAYTEMYDCHSDCVQAPGGTGALGDNSIHHSDCHDSNDDGFQVRGGWDIYNNNIYRLWDADDLGGPHPDGIAAQSSNIRIYNNALWDVQGAGASIYLNILNTTDVTNLYVYNNLIFRTQNLIDARGTRTNTGISFHFELGSENLTNGLVTNNTIVDMGDRAISINIPGSCTDVYVYNNIMYNSATDTAGRLFGTINNGSCCPKNMFDYNDIHPGSDGDTQGAHCNTLYTYADYYNNAYGQQNMPNPPGEPSFVSYTKYAVSGQDFHLAENATAARGRGINLNSYSAICPGISSDKDGVPRPQGSAWEIGAYSYVGNPSPPSNLRILE